MTSRDVFEQLGPGFGGLAGVLHDGNGIIVEDCGYVFRGEFVGGVGYQQARLANSTVANDDAPTESSWSAHGHGATDGMGV